MLTELILSALLAASDDDLRLGDIANVTANIVSCYPHRDDLDAAVTAVAAGDEAGYDEHTRGRAVFLRRGARVLVIGQAGFMGASDRRLRVLGGAQAHRTCWVSADDAQYFDIHAR